MQQALLERPVSSHASDSPPPKQITDSSPYSQEPEAFLHPEPDETNFQLSTSGFNINLYVKMSSTARSQELFPPSRYSDQNIVRNSPVCPKWYSPRSSEASFVHHKNIW